MVMVQSGVAELRVVLILVRHLVVGKSVGAVGGLELRLGEWSGRMEQ